jgi:integrase
MIGNIWGRPRGLGSWSHVKPKLDAATRFNKPWVIHDLRRSAATLLAANEFPPHQIEVFLGHALPGGSLVSVYQRHDYAEERTAMAEKLWELIPVQA